MNRNAFVFVFICLLSSCAIQKSRAPIQLKDGLRTASPESKSLPSNSFSAISKKIFNSHKSSKFSNASTAEFSGVDSVLVMYKDDLIYEKYLLPILQVLF